MAARLTIHFQLAGFAGEIEVEDQDARALVRQATDLVRQMRNLGAEPSTTQEVSYERTGENRERDS